MTAPLLLLVHGWGFDAGFWTPLRRALGDVETRVWDLGFRGQPDLPPPERPVVAVGHSFGLLWLLHERPLTWRALVSINGFPRFTAGPGYPGVAPRLLARMQARLAAAPEAVTGDFLARCGIQELLRNSPVIPAKAGTQGIGHDIVNGSSLLPLPLGPRFRGDDEENGNPPSFAKAVPGGEENSPPLDPARLAWGLDALASWDEMTAAAEVDLVLAGRGDPIVAAEMTRAAFPGPSVEWHDGGHLLPLTVPDWCAHHLRRFVESLEHDN